MADQQVSPLLSQKNNNNTLNVPGYKQVNKNNPTAEPCAAGMQEGFLKEPAPTKMKRTFEQKKYWEGKKVMAGGESYDKLKEISNKPAGGYKPYRKIDTVSPVNNNSATQGTMPEYIPRAIKGQHGYSYVDVDVDPAGKTKTTIRFVVKFSFFDQCISYLCMHNCL